MMCSEEVAVILAEEESGAGRQWVLTIKELLVERVSEKLKV